MDNPGSMLNANHLLSKAILALLVMAALAHTLRHDLAHLAVYQGNARLQAGDASGAAAAWQRAVTLGREAAPLAYNLGVSGYRKGEYAQARKQFAAALATAAPNLREALHYNLGNCQFRLGEQLAARDPQAARGLFQAAIADYGKALALSANAVDASHNLALARARFAALGNGPAKSRSPRAAGAERSPAGSAGNRPPAATGKAKAQASQTPAGAAQAAARADATATAGKPRRDLTQTEAERLLNEARGREKLAGSPHRGNQNKALAKPERDW